MLTTARPPAHEVIKSVPVLKNVLVAATIAAAPLVGALAAGAGGAALQAVLAPAAYVFLGISCRCGGGGAVCCEQRNG